MIIFIIYVFRKRGLENGGRRNLVKSRMEKLESLNVGGYGKDKKFKSFFLVTVAKMVAIVIF